MWIESYMYGVTIRWNFNIVHVLQNPKRVKSVAGIYREKLNYFVGEDFFTWDYLHTLWKQESTVG